MRFENLLDEAIETQFEELDKCEVGSDSQRNAADVVTKLVDRAIEIEKLKVNREEQERSKKLEREMELTKIKEERHDRWIRNGVTVGIALVQIGLTVWGTNKCLKFEETGTVTTSAGRNFINRLFSKK